MMPSFWNFFSLTGDQLFLEVLNHSLSLIPVILAVFLARRLLHKLPRRLTMALWLIVFFRLLVPVTLESGAGLLPQEDLISPSAAAGVEVTLGSTLDAAQRTIGDTLNGGIEPVYVKTRTEVYNLYHSEVWLIVWGYLWPAGMAVMALGSLISFLRLKKKLVGTMRWRDNVWLCDGIDTPFVLGVLRPKIYLPSHLSDSDRMAILAHEQTHIRHFDPAAKLFAWLGLCLHWFNPLVWVSFHLMAEDMEAACDESVIASLPMSERADYADTLLRLATGHRLHIATPLAFGEVDPQGRVRRIFTFQKPKAVLTVLAAALIVVLGFYLVTEHSRDPHLLGSGYQAEELLYQTPGAEPIPVSDIPDFCVTGDYHLLYTFKEQLLNVMNFAPIEEWKNLGQLRSYPLERGELMDMLPVDEGWASSWRPGQVTDAWWLQPEDEVDTFYLLFQTSAGDTLLAIGSEDLSERGQGASDDTVIHYLFQLQPPHSVVYSNPASYFQLDLYQMLGKEADVFEAVSSTSKKWSLCGFSTDDSIGFASYQLVDGYYKLIDLQCYPASDLEFYQLSVPGCYIAPDPVTSVPKNDPDRPVFNSETHDAVFIFNEEVTKVKRVVTNAEGVIVSEAISLFESDPDRPRLLDFSWDQEEGHNPCSVGYYFYDKDGNELN